MPLFSLLALAWTCFNVSKAISLVFRLTCTSENTTHPFVFISSKDDDDVIADVTISLLLFSWGFANRERSKRRDDGKG